MTPEKVWEIATSIANGHAYGKHVLGNKDFGLSLSRIEFANLIQTAITKASKQKQIRRGRWAYWYEPEGMVVVYDPRHSDLGTAFIPREGYLIFRNLR